jgi:Zn-dependent peptidase ImmA (M78 family)/DNA-binding XRE family transcriptional regulator
MANEDKILVLKDQLVKARESLGLEHREVVDKLGIDEENLISWEKGESEPSLEVLWNLAELYQRSTDYFLRHVPALPEQLSFRLDRRKAIKDLPQEVRKVIVRFDELCRAEAELEEAVQEPRKILIKKVGEHYSPQELADAERKRLGLEEQPINDLRKLLINQGVRIFTLPIPEIPANELSGMSWWHDAYGPCILLNGKNNAGRRQFTLAHEYAHLLRADPPTVCAFMLDIPDERFANQFAAVFLMPAAGLERLYIQVMEQRGRVPSDTELGILADHHGVSLEAMGRRLEYLDLIPKGTTELRIAEWQKWKPEHFRTARGPKWRRQLGEEFVSLALQAHSKGHISLSKLVQYFGQNVRTVTKVVEESRPNH